ncbi:YdeI/OmpD-associated family protein [Flavobacterium sp. LS1R47]|uniref:YdeI/OmpD-associated family protein n=1 Tax=Flavobacterium frigoritolerans TaxID=2987686 RepID=A0A9X2Z050_9FLAO|nr:YdeI/OmpD-associated family protein [Flavobacterium frigoritolerans]MCV9933063.1 YdeI/OmpD-associated family protein [Flavobacterium frigoritolerans]
MSPIFFKNQFEFRKWLTQNHLLETELLVGFHKINTNKPSMTWSQSVDEALCFGWIDGVRRSIDKDSYSIRFTPRKATSIWSAINIKKVEDLTKLGLMQPAGITSFKLRKEDKSRIYTHEIEEVHFSDEFEKIFKANEKAWDYFQSLAPSYKKVSKNWVMSAKQETTRIKRLNELIADSMESKNKWK